MKLNKPFLIFLTLIATFSCVKAQTNNEFEVWQLERAWLDAYEQRDIKAMGEIVADDFTITFTNGAIQTKPQIIKSLNAQDAQGDIRLDQIGASAPVQGVKRGFRWKCTTEFLDKHLK